MPRLPRYFSTLIRERPSAGWRPKEACLLSTCLLGSCLFGACHNLGLAPQARTTTASSAAAATPVDPPEEKTHQNTIRWSTASEVDNFGFDVFRGLSADGPFERLNEDPIEGGGTTDEPRRYAYVDDTIDPHVTYFYYVESISMAGDREKFTPVGKAPAKIPIEDKGEPK